MLKVIKKIIPKKMYMYLYIRYSLFKKNKLVNKIIKKYNLKRINIDELKSNKSSQRIYILGSGKSINNITEKQWEDIKKSDSVGFNFWLYHSFVPKFYCYEEGPDKKRNNTFYKILKDKKENYSEVLFLLKSIDWCEISYNKIPRNLSNNYRVCNEINSLGKDKKEFLNFLKMIPMKQLITKRGTVTFLIYLSFLMGYKEIILCGVDLDTTEYFFENQKYNNYEIPKNEMKNIHFTEEKRKDTLAMSEIILILREYLLKNDIKLMLINKVGKLKDDLEILE